MHRWQPVIVAITSLGIGAGLFQDLAKPLYQSIVPSTPSTSWYIGLWQIDVERTLASVPKEVALPDEASVELRRVLASVRAEIEANRGRFINPSPFYLREERGGSVREIATAGLLEFAISPATDTLAIPTLQPHPTRHGVLSGAMTGIHRTADGIYIEGSGVQVGSVSSGPTGKRVEEHSYNMRAYLVRAASPAAGAAP